MAVHMNSVVSSSIAAIGWDRKSSTLYVNFRTKRKYAYDSVSEETFESFLAAESKGLFFNTEIRDKYPMRRLASPGAPA